MWVVIFVYLDEKPIFFDEIKCNSSHYMTKYKLNELVSVERDTHKYLDVKTDIVL